MYSSLLYTNMAVSNRYMGLIAYRHPGGVLLLHPRASSLCGLRVGLHRSRICSGANSTAEIEVSVGSSCAMTLKADIGAYIFYEEYPLMYNDGSSCAWCVLW